MFFLASHLQQGEVRSVKMHLYGVIWAMFLFSFYVDIKS